MLYDNGRMVGRGGLPFTDEQAEAIARREGPLLLSANAGSGKTSVLSERFVRSVLEDDIAPGRILAITFTDKAAGELRTRVRGRFVELGPPRPRRGTSRPPGSRRSTASARGSCAPTRSAPASIPAFTVLEEAEARDLRATAFERALADFLADDRAERSTSSRPTASTRWQLRITTAHDQLRSARADAPAAAGRAVAEPAPRRWRPRWSAPTPSSRPPTSAAASVGARAALARCRELCRAWLDARAARAVGARRRRVQPGNTKALQGDGCAAYLRGAGRLRQRVARRAGRRASCSSTSCWCATPTPTRRPSGRARRWTSTTWSSWRATCCATRRRSARATPSASSASWSTSSRTPTPAARAVGAVGRRPLRRRRRAAVDLRLPACRRRGSSGPSAPRWRRPARPPSWPPTSAAGRTSSRVLDVALGPLHGAAHVPFVAAREDPTVARAPLVELLLTDAEAGRGVAAGAAGVAAPGGGQAPRGGTRGRPARSPSWCAARALPAPDIVVLLRAATDMAVFERAIEEQGLATLAAGGRGYWGRQQVLDLCAYLGALANPRDELALLGLLASPLVGLSADGLAILARTARPGARWDALAVAFPRPGGGDGDEWHSALRCNVQMPSTRDTAARLLPDADRDALTNFCPWFAGEREQAPRRGLDVLLERIVDRTGYDLHVLGLPGGRRRWANVLKLQRLAAGFESRRGRDVRGLIDLATAELEAAGTRDRRARRARRRDRDQADDHARGQGPGVPGRRDRRPRPLRPQRHRRPARPRGPRRPAAAHDRRRVGQDAGLGGAARPSSRPPTWKRSAASCTSR